MTPEVERLVKDARQRYETDATAHALVSMTVQILNQHNHEALGQNLSRAEQAIVRWAAAMALHLGTLDPATGLPAPEPPPVDPLRFVDTRPAVDLS